MKDRSEVTRTVAWWKHRHGNTGRRNPDQIGHSDVSQARAPGGAIPWKAALAGSEMTVCRDSRAPSRGLIGGS